jgi:phosphatidylinositol alpha-1,6-mannosyltransferase
MPPLAVVPPGVDHERFHPLGLDERVAVRRRLGLPTDGRLVVSVSRLVPRKGMDVLIEAVGRLSAARTDLTLAIGGTGRDRRRLQLAARRCGAPVRFLGRVADDDLPMLDAAADIWAMCCRDRWFGLEQEGFGIVFLEAAAAGVAQLAGRSGGSYEAVVDGQTGLVVDRPGDPAVVAAGLARLLDDSDLRERLGAEARRRAVAEFDYGHLARKLHEALVETGG